MTANLYSTYRARPRRGATRKAVAAGRGQGAWPVFDAIAQFGLGLAGIACGGDPSPSPRGC